MDRFFIFILFLAPLIFFHELGHFLFARLFGVRVEVFSLGFGPKLLRFKRGDTTYAIAPIPFGGYVKMYGDDPFNKDAIPEDQRKYSFTHQGKNARFWIVMGGPLANFILAFVLFFTLGLSGEKLPELKLGLITPKTKIYSLGLRPGDKILAVNDRNVVGPTDLALTDGPLVRTVTVLRLDKQLSFSVGMKTEEFVKEVMEYPPYFLYPILFDKKQNAYLLSAYENKLDWETSFQELSHMQGERTLFIHSLDKIDPAKFNFKLKPEKNFKLKSFRVNSFVFKSQGDDSLAKILRTFGLATTDLTIESVSMGSAAAEVGLKGMDIIHEINGTSIWSFEQLRELVQKNDGELGIGIWREGQERQINLTPKEMEINGKKQKLIGVKSGAIFIAPRLVNSPSLGVGAAFKVAAVKTMDSVTKLTNGIKKLITNEISFKNVGGPIRIGKVAGDSLDISLSLFVKMMALFSVHLGLVNLLPIPVLDGGHILFIFLEIINGGPLGRRKMEIAQQLGLTLLLLVMFGAIFNDVSWLFKG